MDQYTRRIIGFGVHAGTVDGVYGELLFAQVTRLPARRQARMFIHVTHYKRAPRMSLILKATLSFGEAHA
jgi:hypothetical protein